MIEIINGCKTYGQKKALNNINLKLQKGCYVAITGPSGCGKSTLLNIIAGYDLLSSGHYLYKGKEVINDDVRLKNDVGMIFQDYQLFDYLTVYENLLMAGQYNNKKLSRQQIYDYCYMTGIEDIVKQYPSTLSGGQKQRVAIARCLLMDKQLLLADEPTGSLDTKNRDEIMSLFDRLHKQGISIIIVSHDEKVASHSETRMYMQDGIIL